MAGKIYIPWLADAGRAAVADTGRRVLESAGWRTRGHGGFRVVEGVTGHHTGTAESAKGDYPSLNVVTKGRADLAGPLCNQGLGRSGDIYVIAAGVGWHAGASAHAGFRDLNDEFVGIEAESAGGGLWTAPQWDMYPRLVGADLKYMNRGVERYVSHRDCALPRGRKPDPRGITDAWMRERALAWMRGQLVTVPGAGSTPVTPPQQPAAAAMKEIDMTIVLPATAMPGDISTPPNTWARRTQVLALPGPCDVGFVANKLDGRDATVGDRVDAWLWAIAWCEAGGRAGEPAGAHLSYAVGGKGAPVGRFWPYIVGAAPAGTIAVVLDYAAPAGASVSLKPKW